MSEVASIIERLRVHDPTLDCIDLVYKQHTDLELDELVDCLLAHPDVVTGVFLDHNRLTDETGVKLARYLATSTTVVSLGLSRNQLGVATYLAIADALCVNTSLYALNLIDNQTVDHTRIDATFTEALRLNPDRQIGSHWQLRSVFKNDFPRLKQAADELGHPTLQMLLWDKV